MINPITVIKIKKRSVWQYILPYSKMLLKKKWPIGLSMMSGKREPIKRTRISTNSPNKLSQCHGFLMIELILKHFELENL